MDGWITIGTKLDSTQLEKDLKQMQRELEKKQSENEKLGNKIVLMEFDNEKYQQTIDKYNKLIEKTKELQKVMQENDPMEFYISDEERVYREGIYKRANEELDKTNSKIAKMSKEYKNAETQIKKNNFRISEANFEIDSNTKRQEELNGRIEETVGLLKQAKDEEAREEGKQDRFQFLKQHAKEAGNSIEKVIKKVARWGLAIFGIRSAYMMIRQALNTITSQDAQLKADIDYIKGAIAYSLEPVVRKIVELAKELITSIGYIIYRWTGVNIFANANKSLQQANASANELKKTLAGFDEMNVLQDTSSSSGKVAPSFDLTDMENVEVPEWAKWIADHKDAMLEALKGLAGLIAMIKLAKFVAGWADVLKIFEGISQLQFFGLMAGLVIAVDGLVNLFPALVRYIEEPTWGHFNTILQRTAELIVGLGIAFVALNASNPVGWVILATGFVLGYCAELSNMIRILSEGKAEIMTVKDAQDALNGAINDYSTALEQLENAEKYEEQAKTRLQEAQEKAGMSYEELTKKMQEEKKEAWDLEGADRELYNAYWNLKKAQDNVEVSKQKVIDTEKKVKDMTWEEKLALAESEKDWESFRDTVVQAWDEGEIEAEEAQTLIERAMSKIDKKGDEVFMKNLPSQIKDGLNPDHYRANAWDLVGVINGIFSAINPGLMLQNVGNWVSSKLAKLGNWGFAKGGIVVPRLASGGVINQPGRGVPLTSAIGGERGAEGVIPLTDSQQMALLGEAIGKYININASIPVYVGNRQVARELRKINAEDDFAFNG